MLLKADLSVDTFFFMSGLLVAYGVLREAERTNGRVNWILYYVHRFLRYKHTSLLILHTLPLPLL